MGRTRIDVHGVGFDDSTALGGITVCMVADDVVDIVGICRRGGVRSLAVGTSAGCGGGINLFVGGRCKVVIISGIVKFRDLVDR